MKRWDITKANIILECNWVAAERDIYICRTSCYNNDAIQLRSIQGSVMPPDDEFLIFSSRAMCFAVPRQHPA